MHITHLYFLVLCIFRDISDALLNYMAKDFLYGNQNLTFLEKESILLLGKNT